MDRDRSRAERETIVTRTEDQKEWSVFSEDRRVLRRLEKLYGPGTPVGSHGGMEWTLPQGGVVFRKPAVATEEQRAAGREAMARLRARKG